MTVQEFVQSFFDEDGNFDASDEQVNEAIKEKFGYDAQFQSHWVGGFDSPGYDIDCYAMAYRDPDGNVVLDSWTRERY